MHNNWDTIEDTATTNVGPYNFNAVDKYPITSGINRDRLSFADKQRNVDEMNDLIRRRQERARHTQPLGQWRDQQQQRQQLRQGRQYNQPLSLANYGPNYLTHPGGQFPLVNPGTRVDAWGAPDVMPNPNRVATIVPANRNLDQINQPYNYNGELFSARPGAVPNDYNQNPLPSNWQQSFFGEPTSPPPPLYPTDLNYNQTPTNSFLGKFSSLWKGGKRTKKRKGGKQTKKTKPKKSRKSRKH